MANSRSAVRSLKQSVYSLKQTKKLAKSRPKVCFHNVCRVVLVPHSNELDCATKEALWWQQKDLLDFRMTSYLHMQKYGHLNPLEEWEDDNPSPSPTMASGVSDVGELFHPASPGTFFDGRNPSSSRDAQREDGEEEQEQVGEDDAATLRCRWRASLQAPRPVEEAAWDDGGGLSSSTSGGPRGGTKAAAEDKAAQFQDDLQDLLMPAAPPIGPTVPRAMLLGSSVEAMPTPNPPNPLVLEQHQQRGRPITPPLAFYQRDDHLPEARSTHDNSMWT